MMYFNQAKVTPICISIAIVLVVVVYFYVLASNYSRKVSSEMPLPLRDSRTDTDCGDASSHHWIPHSITSTSFMETFGDRANIVAMSSEAFNSLFTNKTFKNTECKPRQRIFLKKRRPKIVLVSFKGSGNTWTRHLLEQLTGVWTGDVYTDLSLIGVFIGEVLCPTSNKTFIVKSHEWDAKILSRDPCIESGFEDYHDTERNFDGAILILRNPYDAFLAAFNRKHGGHISAPNRTLLVDNTTEWREFLLGHAEMWKRMNEYWLTRYDGQLHILFYEDLLASLPFELYRLSVFLKTPVSYLTLWCTLKSGKGHFQREKPDWFAREKLYTRDMQRVVDQQIESVEKMLRDKQVFHQYYRFK